MKQTLHIGKQEKVPFSRVYLDPNNPRLGQERPGYDNTAGIFDDDLQTRLEGKLKEIYQEFDDLVQAIVGQGWIPIDVILVWEHPKKKGYYVVVEGNSRTTALREIRRQLKATEKSYAQKKTKKVSKATLEELEDEIAHLKAVVDETEELEVYPVIAKTTEELEDRLPRLLGARHISHAQQWKPYPTGLFMADLYRDLFERHYPGQTLRLDDALVKEVANRVSMGPRKAKRLLQTAMAFTHFKERYEDRLPQDDRLLVDDHYFFENIIQNKYTREQFQWSDELQLKPEMEDVLFKWAFSLPRQKVKENKNTFKKAEDIRLWARMKKFDSEHSTNFADQIDIEDPDNAAPMDQLEAQYLAAKAHQSPVDAVDRLISSLENIPGDAFRSQKSHLVPMLERLLQVTQDYLSMMKAVK